MTRDVNDQLTKYLTDAHSIEEQALQQLRRAPGIAGDPAIARAFQDHLAETQGHERTVREPRERAHARVAGRGPRACSSRACSSRPRVAHRAPPARSATTRTLRSSRSLAPCTLPPSRSVCCT